ncbi:MAG: hypothetical protein FWF54_01605 [Candidatus Azobacteroides sp.]|nr:hypothetical protein [Candidatus Azobacteroides sp.]
MGKLRDDEIRWILSVEAKGAQGEIQNFASVIHKAAEENKMLKLEMKEVSAQVNKAAAELEKLEKKGDTSSRTYQDINKVFQEAQGELSRLKQKFEENNKVIDQNNQKINDVIKTMKLEDMTMSQLKQRAYELQKQMNNTSASLSPTAYKKLGTELNAVNSRMNVLQNTNKSLLAQFAGMNHPIGTAARAVQGFGQALKTLFATPIGWIVALVAGIGMAVKAFFDFNKGYEKLMSTLEQLTGQTGNELKKSAAQIKSFADTIDGDQKQIAKTVHSTAKNFGISWDEAFEVVKEGYVRAGDAADDFFSDSDDFAKSFAKAGYSAKEYFSIVEQGAKAGIPKDKVLGALREFDVRIREFSSKTGKVLKETFGQSFTNDLKKGIASGAITSKEAFQKISEEATKMGINLQENQQLSSALFGKMGKQAGDFSDVVDVINQGLEETNRPLTLMEQATLKEAEATEELEKAWAALFNKSDGTFQMWMANGKAWLYGLLVKIIKGTVDLINYFIDLYNESVIFRSYVQGMIGYLKTLFSVIGTGFGLAIDQVKAFGTMLKGALTLNWNEFNKGFLMSLKNNKDAINDVIDTVKNNYGKAIDNINSEEKKNHISIDLDTGETVTTDKKTKKNKKVRGVQDNDDPDGKKAKKALEARLKSIDNELKQELNLLKKKQVEGLISQKEYDKESERLTLESINKKIEIKGQELDKILALESQKYDLMLKQQEKSDKDLLADLKKKRDKKLSVIEEEKNSQLSILQDTETDQELYALRAAEIEANTARVRERIFEDFGRDVEAAEFKNANNRADAVEENGKDVIEAEKKVLAAREKLRKQFAKTTRDFNRQYNVKTWDERKNDDLRILEKQHDTVDENGNRLLSDEAYEIAKTELEKKYSDERLKIREQYAVAGMAEVYNAELETLQENRRLNLLSEEEFEKAKLKLKLDYLQKYVEKGLALNNSLANMTSALQNAETANIDAKYDAEIARAQGNAEEVERLENEKARKKLDIEKKYADVQFGIRASEIIGNTAVAVMAAWKLGWPAGQIAAIATGIAGAAELVTANAERQKVKNMTLNGTGNSKPATGERVVSPGFSEGGANMDGGYTGAGHKYEIKGYVPYHAGEYFVPAWQMKDIETVNLVRRLEAIRNRRSISNPLPDGFAEGGYNRTSNNVAYIDSTDKKIQKQMLELLSDLKKNGIDARTYLGVTEYQAKLEAKTRAENTFTKS